MSGPEWGYLSVDGSEELKGALPQVVWSDDCGYLACPVLHIDDVPNRKGAEGFSFRVLILRLSDGARRYGLGNNQLSPVKIKEFHDGCVTILVAGSERRIEIGKMRWD